jgi:hypothetical protein
VATLGEVLGIEIILFALNKLINSIYRLSLFALQVMLMVVAKMHFKEQAGSDQKRQAGRQTCQAREYYRGKYHCTVDLLFDWFGIGSLITGNFCFYLQRQTNANQSNRRSMVQGCFPL